MNWLVFLPLCVLAQLLGFYLAIRYAEHVEALMDRFEAFARRGRG